MKNKSGKTFSTLLGSVPVTNGPTQSVFNGQLPLTYAAAAFLTLEIKKLKKKKKSSLALFRLFVIHQHDLVIEFN